MNNGRLYSPLNTGPRASRWRSGVSRTVVLWVCLHLFFVEALILVPSAFHHKSQLVQIAIGEAEQQVAELLPQLVRAGNQPVSLPEGILALSVFTKDGRDVYRNHSGLPNWTASLSAPSSSESFDSIEFRGRHSLNGVVYISLAHVDTRFVKDELIAYVLRVALLVLLIASTLTVATWFVVSTTVVKPLRRVIDALQNPAADAVLSWDRDDEFGELVASYNAMRANVQQAEQEAHRKKQQELEALAYNDPVSKLPNRRAFLKKLDDLNSDAGQVIHVVKLSGMKLVNDQHGSAACDAVIANCGKRLTSLCNEDIYCARLEGGEFGVIQKLTKTLELREARNLGRSMIDSLTLPHYVNDAEIRMTATVGMSGVEHSNLETAYKNAMIAGQHARKGIANAVCVFDSAMRESMLKRAGTLAAMERAIDSDAFFPVYQPKVCIRSHRIVGMECLMRWRDEHGAIISPAYFIPLAEESGLIVPIGKAFFRRALAEVSQWRSDNMEHFHLAVNLSAAQLQDADLLGSITSALSDAHFPADHLEIELTESAVMQNARQAIETLTALSAAGMQIAIDDFGTGYSSLSYLKQLPVNTLKIDQSFVRDVYDDPNDAAIVNAVIGLAHHFNLNVVAEGIETAEQLAFLQQNNCDIGQGYFIGRPMIGEAFLRWCKDWQRDCA